MCLGCPWRPNRSGAPIDDATWETIEERIGGGEAWVCHMTCDGARLLESSLLCAGAPPAGYKVDRG